MSSQPDFNIQYISPSIVRCGQYDFCLEYWEPGIKFTFIGLESGHVSGGVLNFPTAEQWDVQYPLLKGQRERIKSNIVMYANNSTYLKFIADFLLDENRIADAERQLKEARAPVSLTSSKKVGNQKKKVLIPIRQYKKRNSASGIFSTDIIVTGRVVLIAVLVVVVLKLLKVI